ncbi:AAA family ATPase [Streptomyces sp. TBY4]|uniref:AAA family ATPase n=1 Tax=Streptomyces sp. TBY4 TaxID=2962030 RepID=UPI0020B793F5|nr:LuxR family transcriptional regulator [Streptomyces sp. TBY4]MCP3760673.1 AAA family ATPase [Streptomyces sp. TBY4]
MALLHREEELAQLTFRLDRCFSGESEIMLLQGAAGCGKTEILIQLAQEAKERGAVVLRATALPAERGMQHAVLRQLLADLPGGALPEKYTPEKYAHEKYAPGTHFAGIPSPQEFDTVLRELARGGAVVLCIDDLHHADGASLDHLLHLARSLRQVPVLLALGETLTAGAAELSAVRTDLLRHPAFTRIRVGCLDARGTAGVLLKHTGALASPALVTHLRRTTGGNPLLLKALLSEHPGPVGDAREWPAPVPGGPFTEAVSTCLQRSGDAARHLATAIAALGDEATPELAARVARTTATSAHRTVAVLDAVGITEGWRLRHPAVSATLLDDIDPERRGALHVRAARVLHDAGSRSTAVAQHLLDARGAAGHGLAGAVHDEGPADGWAVPALREAARQALLEDDCAYTVGCLELARELSDEEQVRWDIGLRLAAVVRRTDPQAAESHLAAPLEGLRAGRLGPASSDLLAGLLVVQGRIEDANDALAYAQQRRGYRPAPQDPLRALFDVWNPGDGEADDAAVEKQLKDTPLTHATLDAVVQAVRTLIHTDRCDRAAAWCQKLQAEKDGGRAPGWYAALGLLHAQALLRLGDLAGAEREAAAAADAVAGRGGTLLYGLIAAQATALTAMGRYESAAGLLELPVPEGAFGSVFILDLLRARGHYYLATHRGQAALGEFLAAGRLACRWELDRPGLVPWRTDAAAALIHLGEYGEAERLATEQLSMPDARSPWVQGTTLRVRAATAAQGERPRLLGRAVEELRKSGDRLELARALADLGRALQALGEGNRAGTITRRAWQLAADCAAGPLCDQILPGRSDTGRRPVRSSGPVALAGPSGRLSGSGRRVASLAALGYTNREISAQLYITVSTVEQHLTRAFRTLNISRRQDLPVDLHYGEPGDGPIRQAG